MKTGIMPTLCVLLSVSIVCADHRWTGTSGDWDDPANWDQLSVPDLSDKVLVNNGGTGIISTSASCAQLLLGTLAASTGTVEVAAGGSLQVAGDIYLCNRANSFGLLRIKPGGTVVRGQGWLGLMTVGAGGRGELHMEGGDLLTWGLYLGNNNGDGYAELSGDARLISVGNTRVGTAAGATAELVIRDQASLTVYNQTPYIGYGGTGIAQVVGGCLMTSNTATKVITVGYAGGTGTLQLGNEHTTGVVSNSLNYFGSYVWRDGSMTVRGDAASEGLLCGWGTVALRLSLINNGRILADGFGVADRTLDLSWFGTDLGGGIFNTIDNTGDNGWFAVRRGKIALPAVPVAQGATATVNWGENQADTSIDLVNSARITFEAPSDFALEGALLAPDRTDVPEGLYDPHSVWSFAAGDFDNAVLTVRYDDGEAVLRLVDEADLKLWRHNGQRWIDVTGERDSEAMTLTSVPQKDLGFFAVATRKLEPTTVLTIY